MSTPSRRRFVRIAIAGSICVLSAGTYGVLSAILPKQPATPMALATADQTAQAKPLPYEPACRITYVSDTAALVADPDNPDNVATAQVPWDDRWFLDDATAYNHELATACMVLCAAVNSGSVHYSGSDDEAPLYAEKALKQLGFSGICSESFVSSSSAADEMANLMDDDTDEVAYVFAYKELPSDDGGEPDVLVFAGVRGTYGAEWISDLHVANPSELGEEEDHGGYSIACVQMLSDLADYLDDQGLLQTPERVKFLITGHSRGASVANLLARDLLRVPVAGESPAQPRDVFAYTFAASPTTRSDAATNEEYRGIFNIVNPTDVVPKVPLATWGYRCYGTEVLLPGLESPGYDDAYGAMQVRRAANSGAFCTVPYQAGDVCPAQVCADELAERIPTLEDLGSFDSAVQVVRTALGHDLSRILVSHYPDTYIAWMQTVNEESLEFEA